MSADEASAELADWRPSGPAHPFQPSVELARALSAEDALPILITDRPERVDGAMVVAVGEPLANSGWTSSHWTGRDELFAVARHFGRAEGVRTVSIYGDDALIGRSDLDFSARSAVPIAVTVPPEVRTVRLELPEDALPNDNALLTTRPVYQAVGVAVEVEDERLARYVRKAVAAVPRAAEADQETASLLVSTGPRPQGSAAYHLRLHVPAPAAAQNVLGPYSVSGYHPLTQGVDMHGVIWPADPGFTAGDAVPLIAAGELPLLVAQGDSATLNLGVGGNVFRMAAWPVIMANVVEHVYSLSPGLKRLSYRLGEGLSFYRPASWQGVVDIERPDGSRVAFDGDHIYYGRLEREGIYTIRCGGERVGAFDVNLLSEDESDLTAAETFGTDQPAQAAEVRERGGHRFHREFSLLVLAMLLGCWYLLDRRAP